MKLLMPSHASKVQQYKEPMPLFVRHHVEDQLESAYNAETQLKSGGYLVIHQTEALVAIDVNSGRSTKERNIEDTALKTNLEAADEAARQMRLRDLAGLVVIDFIDMEENRNIRAVEKRMKDAMKKDRARLQMGRISQFGLMEISRQRRRTSILEGSTKTCPHCGGKGYQRTPSSSALVALRALEEEGARKRAAKVRITLPTDVALYLLNEKRDHVLALEQRYDFRVLIGADPDLIPPDCNVEVIEARDRSGEPETESAPVTQHTPAESPASERDDTPTEDSGNEGDGRRRRGRRRRRKDEDGPASDQSAATTETDENDSDEDGETKSAARPELDENGQPRKRRRRGRRGGRGRRRGRGNEQGENNANAEGQPDTNEAKDIAEAPAGMAVIDPEAEAAPLPTEAADTDKPKRRTRRKKADAPAEAASEAPAEDAATEPQADAKPKRTRKPRKKPDAETDTSAPDAAAETPAATEDEKPKRKRAPRKTAAAKAKAETPADESAPEDKPKPRRAAKKPAAKAEPKAEAKAETKADAPAESAPAEKDAKDNAPKRSGWWQKGAKLFGG